MKLIMITIGNVGTRGGREVRKDGDGEQKSITKCRGTYPSSNRGHKTVRKCHSFVKESPRDLKIDAILDAKKI